MNLWERIDGLLFKRPKPIKMRPKLENSHYQFGAIAKVRATAVTESAGLAGREGIVFGQTTPSVSGATVIGDYEDDYAVNVSFDNPSESHWFAESLLELVTAAPDTAISMDVSYDKKHGGIQVHLKYNSVEDTGPE